MKLYTDVSRHTIVRLFLYYQALKKIQDEGGEWISSKKMGRCVGTTAENVRKDLSVFGYFGRKGLGYSVTELVEQVGEILGYHRQWNAIVVGTDCYLGSNYRDFLPEGVNIVAVVNMNEKDTGQSGNNSEFHPCSQLSELVEQLQVHIGILAVPAAYAQKVANKLVAAKVKGICNLSPVNIFVPRGVVLINHNLAAGLGTVTYCLHQQNEENSDEANWHEANFK